MATASTGVAEPLDPERLRGVLEPFAARGSTMTYQQAAQALGVRPPQTIHRTIVALERLMDEDAAAGRPLLAAVVVSRTAPMPAAGFFARARSLGLYEGPDTGPEAAAFHRQELQRLRQTRYSGS